jgi:hypothetical protein
MSGVVAPVGRLVDVAAAMTQLTLNRSLPIACVAGVSPRLSPAFAMIS